MRKSSANKVILFLFCACVLLGCNQTSDDATPHSPMPITQTPYSTSTPTLSPTSTTTPAPQFTFNEITLLSDDVDGATVFGWVRNETGSSATDIEVRISLLLNSSQLLLQEERTLPIAHLQPGEEFPVFLQYPEFKQVDKVEIKVIDFQKSMDTDIELEVLLTGVSKTENDQYAILGWISNPRSSHAKIHHFFLAQSNQANNTSSLVIPDFHVSVIPPSQKVPFMAIMEQDPTVLSTKPFMDATEIQSLKAMPISFPEQSPLTLDSQGNPLLRGSIRNDDTISRWVSCIVALQYQDQLISLSRLVPAIPLTSGENRAFGLSHFPGWRSQFREHGIGLDEIHVEFYCDPLASVEYKGQILTLNSEVTGFEATGSSLIIRGEVYNHISQALPHVVVQADLRAIDGSIHASNFILVEEPIEIAGSSTFVLPVRLPAGTILPELEMDIRAIALLDNNVLPYE